jgi:hypothetical protein
MDMTEMTLLSQVWSFTFVSQFGGFACILEAGKTVNNLRKFTFGAD